MASAHPLKAIGSVFPDADEEAVDLADSLWRRWTAGFAHATAFRTARGALRALLIHRRISRIWLPAYTCQATVQAAPSGCEVRFFGHGPGLPLMGLLPQAGDAVLGVDYFGHADPALAERAGADPDVLWIEDRAQALDPAAPAWGEVILYSPRKLLGVGDGGVLVSNAPLPRPDGPAPHDPTLWAPHRARSLDPQGRSPDVWSVAFQTREATFDVSALAMQARTRSLLERVSGAALVERRIANATAAQALLPDYALWPETPIAFAPLAFPIRVADAAEAVRALAGERIFCARHWADLPSPSADFADAHRLSRQLVSLPCDQRYDAADMARVAAAVRRLCRPADGSR